MKKLLFILCLLSFNALAETKCESVKAGYVYKGTLCENENSFCIIPMSSEKQIICVKK